MIHVDRFESALRAPDPARALRTSVLELAASGHPKAELYERLEQFLLDLRARDDHPDSDEDAVLDVLDTLTGWCHPEAQLRPERP